MKLNFEQPLPHRPGVLVHRGPDGKRVVIGDGSPFSPSEHAAISTVIEPQRHDLPFTAQERAELEAAEARLAEALRLRGLAADAMFDAHDRGRRFERSLGRVGAREAKRIAEIKAAYDDARRVWDEAGETEHLARVEQTNTSRRVHHAARMRKLAAERAETPPLNTPPTLTERMESLTGRLA